MNRKYWVLIIVGSILICTSAIVYAVVTCNERPQAWVCGETSNYDGDEEDGEQPDGDCDEGDKYESRPDPDCNGIWYGTPAPGGVRKTPSNRLTTTKTQPNKGAPITTRKFK